MAVKTIPCDVIVNETVTATKFIVPKGISNQFLKADGSLDNTVYATEEELDTLAVTKAEYVKEDKKIYFYNNNGDKISTIDATDFVLDGMLDSVTLDGNNYLVFVFNTDAGKNSITVPLSSMVPEELTEHLRDFNNPHKVTKEQVGLGNADNTSDINKPVSTAQQAALDGKLDKTSVKQAIGTSTTDVMSQKAVTDAINTAVAVEETRAKEAEENLIVKVTDLEEKQGIYNVDVNVPLSGQFYTATTARNAVPTSIRKIGLIITYKTDSTTSVTEQFIGASISNWGVDSNWKNVGSDGGNKILEWNTDIATTRKQVPLKERKQGLQVRYAIDDKEWVQEEYIGTNFSDSSWASDVNWNYEKFKGEITDVSQAATLDKRAGVYYTSCAKGEFTNFLQSDGSPLTNYMDRYFSIVRLNNGFWGLTNIQDIFYGSDYIWGMISKGYISMNTSSRIDEGSGKKLFKYSLEVFPNTIILPINSIPHSMNYAIGLKEGVYEFESIHNAVLFMVNPKTREIEFSTSKDTENRNNINQTLPPPSDKNKYILLGCSGSVWTAGVYSYFPFVGLHMNVENYYQPYSLGKTNEICCLNDYSFYDISSKVENLTFKGECHLDLEDTDEDNIYYILGSKEANTYTFDNIPITIVTEKRYSAFAIKKKNGEWSYEEVPLSFCGQNSTAPYHVLNQGVYVINRDYRPNNRCCFTLNITGIHGVGNVLLIFISETGEGSLTLGDWYNVKIYGSIFLDYYQRDNNIKIENCEFSGPSWRTGGSTYFINCHFYKRQWYSNVLIKNCKFTFDKMYTVIWGDRFDNLEITGCEFNVRSIYHPIRVNIFKTSVLIRGNKVYNGVTGIFFGSTKSFPQVGAVIENNIIMYQSEEGISCDGFGNNYYLIPVIANGNIEEAYNDKNGRLVVKPHLYTGTSSTDTTLVNYPISTINNWKDYYITFNRGTGIDGTICRIYDYDAGANTFTLDIYVDSSKIKTSQGVPKLGDGSSEDSIIGVQSGFFDMVIRNNILKSDRQDYCTALSNYLNVFNTLIENNKVYLMNSFMNIAGGLMLSVMETLCWGVKVINNTFMNCNIGSFTSYWDSKLPQFNNVFQGNIIKNVKKFEASGQKNFVFKDNVWDNVDGSKIKNCESYIPNESDLKVHQMGNIYNKFINDDSTLLLKKIEQYIVDMNEEETLILKKL